MAYRKRGKTAISNNCLFFSPVRASLAGRSIFGLSREQLNKFLLMSNEGVAALHTGSNRSKETTMFRKQLRVWLLVALGSTPEKTCPSVDLVLKIYLYLSIIRIRGCTHDK